MPYIIPKLAVLAIRRWSAVTSSYGMPKIFAAVAAWTSTPSRKALIKCESQLRWAMILSSIWE